MIASSRHFSLNSLLYERLHDRNRNHSITNLNSHLIGYGIGVERAIKWGACFLITDAKNRSSSVYLKRSCT